MVHLAVRPLQGLQLQRVLPKMLNHRHRQTYSRMLIQLVLQLQVEQSSHARMPKDTL